MKTDTIRKNAQNMVDYQKNLASKGEDFSAGTILSAERIGTVVADVADAMTDEERERVYASYAKAGRDMTDVADIKAKYGLSWSELHLIAKTCGPKVTPQARYDKANTRMISIKLNKKTDADILEKFESVDNIGQYIRKLIREDIAR